ncbi:MAG: hypothetical protein HFG89_00280 [Dorea sp.]|nr:hypothetical protein [Dorea sp.]
MAHLFVIAGHGAGDSGAVGYGFTEAERVRVLAKRISEIGGENVTLGDISRNYYADRGINTLNIPKDWQIIELHMDAASSSARGGHVIIKEGLKPDQYDRALAEFISETFPGRAQSIYERSNLYNVNRSAARGFSYRLVEFGFITNNKDLDTFNSHIDDIAKGVLSAFDIQVDATQKKKELVDGELKTGGVTQTEGNDFGEVSYQVHARGIGWCNWKSDGDMAGTTGQNRRIEAFRLVPVGKTDVSVHIKGIGDRTYYDISKDTVIGTTGEQKRIEAVKITGHDSFYRYRVHQKGIGWSEWANNGEWSGSKGQSLQIEAIEVMKTMFIVTPHIQGKGWISPMAAENLIGITGHNLRLEAFKINSKMEIKAKAHIQGKGWIDYGKITKDTVIGTTGEKKRLECLCFKGDFDYRVHIQNSGWTDWTKADGVSTLGTVGQALRIEAIQFRKK